MSEKVKKKKCTKCKKIKPLTLFDRFSHHLDGHCSWCKECVKKYSHRHYLKHRKEVIERTRKYAVKNKHKIQKWMADYLFKKRYGITLEDYNELLIKQKGRCAICGSLPKHRRLDIDHDHKTGQIRGLLCNRCNQGLGYLGQVLKKAMDYLK